MSSTAKVVFWIVVLAVIALAAYYLWPSGSGSSAATQNPSSGATASSTSTALPASGNSDTALEQDSAAITAQMSGLDSDNANVNQSFNDQPVSQSY